jgi:hypothetical protein
VAVAKGIEVYNADSLPVVARGYAYAQVNLVEARANDISAILTDEEGQAGLANFCDGLSLTGFAMEILEETLEPNEEEDHSRGWREGEALAEAWLTTHKECEFPWPFHRDLRHHRASMPGAEMVGMVGAGPDDAVLAFGQVKTSKEEQWPPQVVNRGPKCLINQMCDLREDEKIKKTLVQYLAHRGGAASGAPWVAKFQAALIRYCESGKLHIAIFGVLIRDVAHAALDLSEAAATLAQGCDLRTRMELVAIYLPAGSIPAGPQHGPRRRRRTQS